MDKSVNLCRTYSFQNFGQQFGLIKTLDPVIPKASKEIRKSVRVEWHWSAPYIHLMGPYILE